MQFYVIHPDPDKNAALLPDYAIRRVNVREGYQILSDCGHAVSVNWSTQNKEYNRFHPTTWQYWKNKDSFYTFISHYMACLSEYEKRFGNDKTYTTYKNKFDSFIVEGFSLFNGAIFNFTDEQHMALYMLRQKEKHLTESDIDILKHIAGGGE
jgi:hypothetical protein